MEQTTKREKNFFSLYDAKGDISKNWFWYWYDRDGKRVRRYGEINREKTLDRRQKAAKELLEQLQREYVPPPPNHAEVSALLGALEKWRPTVRNKSYISYRSKLTSLLKYQKGRVVDRESMAGFFDEYARTRAQSTVHDCFRMLFLIFDRAGMAHLLKGIKIKKGHNKPLRYFQPHQAAVLKDYLSKNDPELWLYCQFVYFCFIRPRSELRFLQVKHIFFEERKILIPGTVAKNNKTQYVAIPDTFYPALAFLKRRKPNEFLFPSRRDESKPIGVNTLGEKHREILDKLGFDNEYQVYSWKHTGAVNAVKAGISLKDLQIQLRHHSLDMVDKYLRQLGVTDLGNLRAKFPAI